eukprot:13185051-Alexandrium_andersonii.AAC.1
MLCSQRPGLCRSASVSPRNGSGLRARWIRTPSLEPAASVAGLNIADVGTLETDEARAAGCP